VTSHGLIGSFKKYKNFVPYVKMRSLWQEHIRKTHTKLSRKNKEQKYHESMRIASKTWSKEKVKIIKRNKRLARQKQLAPSKATNSGESSGSSDIKSDGVM
jgi:hypothetical protein